MTTRFPALIGTLCLLTVSSFAHPAALDLLVSRDGVYSVTFEALHAHGFEPTPTRSLLLTNHGAPVPVWVDGRDDGRLGPGDRLSFIGRHLSGATGYYDDATPYNVYHLSSGGGGILGSKRKASKRAGTDLALVRRHLEQDRVRVRFAPGRVKASAEIWYWKRLSVLDRAPFGMPVDLGKVRSVAGRRPVAVRVGLRGWSYSIHGGKPLDHRVELLWNGRVIGRAEWAGQQEHTIDISSVPMESLRDGKNLLQLRVPPRRYGKDQNLVVDVVLLNWIELAYPFDGELARGQIALMPASDGSVNLDRVAPSAALYSPSGWRSAVTGAGARVTAGSSPLMLVAGDAMAVDAIRTDRPSSLTQPDHQADYLIIAHGSLVDAIRPLAEFHRAQGLNVELIDVQDLYDELNFGIVSPEAIKSFISYAYHSWRKPAPRFVLLVGDASWDTHLGGNKDRNYADWTFGTERGNWFVKNASTPYARPDGRRNLVPTLQVPTFEGYAASDTALVAVDGDDWLPDLAVGRIPVVTPHEAKGVVDKLLAYAKQAGQPGKWRRDLLLITNDDPAMQRRSDELSADIADVGLAMTRVYPREDDADNARHQSRLLQAFDEGQLLVHFLGHGGRYIWRTGPPDLKKNHDLFTLDHVDRLKSSTRLPLVLSMTCYSAPFDHPTADSIGEKLLRVPARGAIGVLAASWRNNPSQRFSRRLLIELTRPDVTVGEAINRAKRWVRTRLLVQTYNYLGDPATRLLLPGTAVLVDATTDAQTPALHVDVDLRAVRGLDMGSALMELLGEDDKTIAQWSGTAHDGRVSHTWSSGSVAEQTRRVRVYAWSDASGVDAIGSAAVFHRAGGQPAAREHLK